MAEIKICPNCGSPLANDAPAGLCPNCLLKGAIGAESQPAATAALNSGFVAPEPTELGVHFPQLEILELLGKGGMGAVYKARQKQLDRFVALKILPADVARDPAFAERFAREARALAQLNHHNIVNVYDFGQSGGLYYLMMEYVDGANLRELIRSRSLNPGEALAIVPQICEALQFAHDEGIVHRDIKPENILVNRRGQVKIADFGLAKLLGIQAGDVTLTHTQQVMGTWNYMAPEQMQGSSSVDHRADIYSLGVVLYELLTGELPVGRFAAPSAKVHLDIRLDEVVFRALEQEPQRRYQHASDMKTDVETIVSKSPLQQPPTQLAMLRTDDFLFCNPRLPKVAQLICLYGMLISPILFALAFSAGIGEEDEMMLALDFLYFPIHVLTVLLLLVGAIKLRGLRKSGVIWLQAGFLLEIIALPAFMAFAGLWAMEDAEMQRSLESPTRFGDYIELFLVTLCYGFDILAVMWLFRHRRDLPLISRREAKQLAKMQMATG